MKFKSPDSGNIYEVTPHSCTCPHWQFRLSRTGGKCKHIIQAFYPHLVGNEVDEVQEKKDKDDLNMFKGGMTKYDAFEKFGAMKIRIWIESGEICEHNGKFHLLE